MVRTLRAVCLLAGLALGGWSLVWTAAPFLLAPGQLAAAGPLLAVVSTCAWLSLVVLGWLGLGVLVTVCDVLRDRRRALPAVLAPAFLRRVVVVCVGVGLSGSVTGVAAAQPTAPPVPAESSAGLLDGLVVPDRVEDRPLTPRTRPSRPEAPPGATSDAAPDPTPDQTPDPSSVATPDPAPDPAPDPGPDPAPGVASDAAPVLPASRGPMSGQTLVVRPGDSLWTLAAARLPQDTGSAAVDAAWRRLYQANRPPLGADPDLIHPGDVLRIPRDLTSDREEPR